MNETNAVPMNWILLMLLICVIAAWIGLLYTPDLMDRVAMKLRARARAMRSANEHWKLAYRDSIHADLMRDQQTEELNRMMKSA